MSEINKVLFIINRFSGSGYRKGLEGRIISQCEARKLECSIEFTKKQGHGTTLARMAVKKNYKIVFAVGGDGTVNEVAKGLLHTGIPLGIIPKGSGNGLARHLQIPLTIDKSLKMLDLEKIVAIDTFTINDRLSLNVSGIGFDGHVAGLFGKDGKRGLISYGRIVVSNFIKFKEFAYEITLNDKIVNQKSFLISIANSSQFGNNAVIAPHASVCDHELDISMVQKMNIWQGLGFVVQLFNKNVDKSRFVSLYKAQKLNITTHDPIPYHVDGEAAGTDSNFAVTINPASLLISIPKSSNSV